MIDELAPRKVLCYPPLMLASVVVKLVQRLMLIRLRPSRPKLSETVSDLVAVWEERVPRPKSRLNWAWHSWCVIKR